MSEQKQKNSSQKPRKPESQSKGEISKTIREVWRKVADAAQLLFEAVELTQSWESKEEKEDPINQNGTTSNDEVEIFDVINVDELSDPEDSEFRRDEHVPPETKPDEELFELLNRLVPTDEEMNTFNDLPEAQETKE